MKQLYLKSQFPSFSDLWLGNTYIHIQIQHESKSSLIIVNLSGIRIWNFGIEERDAALLGSYLFRVGCDFGDEEEDEIGINIK